MTMILDTTTLSPADSRKLEQARRNNKTSE